MLLCRSARGILALWTPRRALRHRRVRRVAVIATVGVVLVGSGWAVYAMIRPSSEDLSARVNSAQANAIIRYARDGVWPVDGGSSSPNGVGCAIHVLGAHRGQRGSLTVFTDTICLKCPLQLATAEYPMAYYLQGNRVVQSSLRTGYDAPQGVDALDRVFPAPARSAYRHQSVAESKRLYEAARARGGC